MAWAEAGTHVRRHRPEAGAPPALSHPCLISHGAAGGQGQLCADLRAAGRGAGPRVPAGRYRQYRMALQLAGALACPALACQRFSYLPPSHTKHPQKLIPVTPTPTHPTHQVTDPTVMKSLIFQKGWVTPSTKKKREAEAANATLQARAGAGRGRCCGWVGGWGQPECAGTHGCSHARLCWRRTPRRLQARTSSPRPCASPAPQIPPPLPLLPTTSPPR